MAQWLGWTSQEHQLFCSDPDLEVMGSKLGRVEYSPSVLSLSLNQK